MKSKKSENLFRKALKLMPGGVNSPVRSFNAVGGIPRFIKSAKGSMIHDVDGNQYIDYVGSWGPMILGHANPAVVKALKLTTSKSTSFGAPSEAEVELAELMISLVPGLEMIRMVNSGTEACMSAVRLARAYTKKTLIIKFEGCYHGHADSFLIKAGSGLGTLGLQGSPGVPDGVIKDTIVIPYNDLEAVADVISKNRGKVAAVIVEPVAGNMGCIPPVHGFLKGLRKFCDKENALLIFDEVMTGFRISSGGAVTRFGIKPDLMTFGKIIGGGLPVGAYGGRKKIMKLIAPGGPVYQAGTLSGNPLAMTAGIEVLRILKNNPGIYNDLEKKGSYLEEGLITELQGTGIFFRINRVGSMISLHFTPHQVSNFEDARRVDLDKFKIFFHAILDKGIYWPPSAFESAFISIAHTIPQLDKTIAAFKSAFRQIGGKNNRR